MIKRKTVANTLGFNKLSPKVHLVHFSCFPHGITIERAGSITSNALFGQPPSPGLPNGQISGLSHSPLQGSPGERVY